MLLIISTGVAIGNSLTTPVLNTLASLASTASTQGLALGTMQSMGSLGRILGPLLGGWLFATEFHFKFLSVKNGMPFWAGGVAILMGVLIFILWPPKKMASK